MRFVQKNTVEIQLENTVNNRTSYFYLQLLFFFLYSKAFYCLFLFVDDYFHCAITSNSHFPSRTAAKHLNSFNIENRRQPFNYLFTFRIGDVIIG